MLDIGLEKVKIYEQQLEQMPKALHFAERNTLNDLAFETRREAQENIREQMTLRNKWTERSVMVQRAKRLSDPAIVGSAMSYMYTQEFGGTKTRKGQKGVPLATGYASGEGETSGPRKRLPRGRNKLAKIRLRQSGGGGMSRRQRNLVAIREAAKSGRREVYIDTGRKQFIARVTGGKRSPRLRMIYDLSRRSVEIPANPWLLPATNTALRKRNRLYANNLRYQLKRLQKARG